MFRLSPGVFHLNGRNHVNALSQFWNCFFLFARPTMILYGINNIRDLIGPKVDLEMCQRNPLCRVIPVKSED